MEIGVGKNNAPGPDYKAAVVLGVEDVPPQLLVGAVGAKYAVTRVPSELAEKWFADNAKSRYVLDKAIFIIK